MLVNVSKPALGWGGKPSFLVFADMHGLSTAPTANSSYVVMVMWSWGVIKSKLRYTKILKSLFEQTVIHKSGNSKPEVVSELC